MSLNNTFGGTTTIKEKLAVTQETTGVPAYISLESSNGTAFYMWFGNGGKLRISTEPPYDNDESKAVLTES